MLRIALGASALALCLALPAFAQGTMSGPSSTASTMKAADTGMTCSQMMNKATSMSSTSAAAMSRMQNEMGLAKKAKANNDEAGCKMHMQKAMAVMK